MNSKNHLDLQQEQGGAHMETPQIREETREKLEDAAVSVFMEQYAKALDAGIDSMMEESAEDVFLPELDQRIQKLIARESAKERKKKYRKTALRVLGSAAAVVMVLLSACSILFVTVEAFRVPVMNFFVEKTDSYWQLSGALNTAEIPDVFNPEDPLKGIIPDDFELVTLMGTLEESNLNAVYRNQDEASISLVALPYYGKAQLDFEDADAIPCSVLGHDALKSVEDALVRIAWIDGESEKVITLCATNISAEMTAQYAESFAACLDG